MEDQSQDTLNEASQLKRAPLNGGLLGILGNAIGSSQKHDAVHAGTETRKCATCGAARPADTDLQHCAYCGHAFY